MKRKMLRSKIHRATVTQCDPDYVGSITIDANLLHEVDLLPNEAVHVFDIDNGARLETYVIRGEPGSGVIGINGAAARLINQGDRVIIVAFAMLEEAELQDHIAHVVVCDEHNRVAQKIGYASRIDVDTPVESEQINR